MILLCNEPNTLPCQVTGEGVLLTSINNENGVQTVDQLLLKGAVMCTMKVVTYADISPGSSYNAEICAKYDLPSNVAFQFHHEKHTSEREIISLHTCSGPWGESRCVDDDFDYRKEERIVSAVLLSDSMAFEVQHIDPSEKANLDSIYSTERILNQIVYNNQVRIVDLITYV